ncbi:MAG: adenosylmethionine decarboxylase [Victivallales bacterium]|jgi:S-adenosylmethionine decarboxylase proenzyme
MNNIFALGRHITVELSGCDASIIADSKAVETALLEAAEASGAHIIESSFHYFAPQGVSGFVIISESHFSIHTWPEYDYAAVDVFTCGDTISPYAGIDRLKRLLHAQEAQISADMWRGTSFNYTKRIAEQQQGITASGDLEKLYIASQPYGISCSIDLSACGNTEDGASERCLAALASVMHCQTENVERKTFDHGNTTVLSVFNMDSSIVIRRDLCSRSAHIDLFCKSYTDPRVCATTALEVFEAKSYKIHPAFRMS